jgi:hypothetical protein
MVAIVSRAGKGSPLTNAEVDANFANLNNGKVETNSSAVIAALGYTPYNATNPSNFLDQAGVRGSFSVTGDLTYNSTTGVFGVNVPVTSVAGKTGAVTLVKADVGLGNVDNTADASKSVASAAILTTARLIGGVSFNGSANINLPGVNAAGNQDTTGSAATLTTGRTIGMTGDVTWTSASFNGSANVTGTATLANSGVTAGSYTTANITVDAKGRITSASSGTSGLSITDDTSTNATRFLTFTSATSGSVSGQNVSSTKLTFNPSTGNFTAGGNVQANSDERLKTSWLSLPADFIERAASAKSGTYTRIDSGERQAGSSAQDWQKLLPEVVSAGPDGTLSLAYGNAALVLAMELAKRVLELEQKLAVTNQNIAEVRGK